MLEPKLIDISKTVFIGMISKDNQTGAIVLIPDDKLNNDPITCTVPNELADDFMNAIGKTVRVYGLLTVEEESEKTLRFEAEGIDDLNEVPANNNVHLSIDRITKYILRKNKRLYEILARQD